MSQVQLVLASASPRRQTLLKQIGLSFEIHPSHIHEAPHEEGAPSRYAEELARDKALEIAKLHPDGLVLGADTIVVVDEHVLGKPVDEQDAFKMLRMLAGRSHEVVTAYSLISLKHEIEVTKHVTTEVHFKELSDREIQTYIDTGAPMDKAGSYGIQDFSGVFVDRISGCFYNVVGLPLSHFNTTLRSILDEHGLSFSS